MEEISRQLTSFIDESRSALLSISEARASEKPFPEKWSIKEILGHLMDSAANNLQRIVRMQEKSDIGAFGYSQEHWVRSQQYQGRPWVDLVELWHRYNAHLAHVIGRVDPASISHTCDMGYPSPAPLKFVIEDYLRHVQHHVSQILGGADPRERTKWVPRDPGKE